LGFFKFSVSTTRVAGLRPGRGVAAGSATSVGSTTRVARARPRTRTHARTPAHAHARAHARARARGRVIGLAGSFPIDRPLSGLPTVRSRSIAGPPGPPDRLGLRRGPYDRSGSIGRDRTGHEPPGRADRSGSIVEAPDPGAGHRKKLANPTAWGLAERAGLPLRSHPGPSAASDRVIGAGTTDGPGESTDAPHPFRR
jgi:hypothetical protein